MSISIWLLRLTIFSCYALVEVSKNCDTVSGASYLKQLLKTCSTRLRKLGAPPSETGFICERTSRPLLRISDWVRKKSAKTCE